MARASAFLLSFCALLSSSVSTQHAAVLRDVKTIQVTATVVPQGAKVKEDFAPNLMQDMLRNALRNSNFEIADAPTTAHIVLKEFTSGSTTKRLMVGFGAGRSTVDGMLVFEGADHKELASVPIRVRGNLMFSSYQGDNTQRRQASNAFEQKLMEEIARLK